MPNRNLSPQFGSHEYTRQVAAGTHPPAFFASAKEIHDTHTYGDAGADDMIFDKKTKGYVPTTLPSNPDKLMDYKRNEDPELTSALKKHGYDWNEVTIHHDPVSARNDTLMDGHHRVAAMLKHRPNDYMPLETLK